MRIQRFDNVEFLDRIEKLNKEFLDTELQEEDKEDFSVARSFMEWYIGESQPVRRPILVKHPKKGHSTRRITQLKKCVGRIYKYNGFRAKTDADLLPTEYKYIWVAPERLAQDVCHSKNENAMAGAQSAIYRPIMLASQKKNHHAQAIDFAD